MRFDASERKQKLRQIAKDFETGSAAVDHVPYRPANCIHMHRSWYWGVAAPGSARRGVVETKTLPSSPRSLPARLRARSTDVRGSVPMFLSCSSSAREMARAGGSDSCLMECRQGRTRSETLALVARHVDNLCHAPAPASLGPPISPMNRRFRSAGGTEPYDYIHFVILDFFPPRL